jgi:chromosome segregation ATPase
MSAVKDPAGNPLKRVLLQVIDSDEKGPITLRARLDHEKIDITDERQRKFYMVWVTEDQELGVVWLNDLVKEFYKLKEIFKQREDQASQLTHQIDFVKHEFDSLRADNDRKTEALRVLQRERDPTRFDASIAERIAERTKALEDKLSQANMSLAKQRSEIEELKASKKRLREALDRAKEKK